MTLVKTMSKQMIPADIGPQHVIELFWSQEVRYLRDFPSCYQRQGKMINYFMAGSH